MAKTWTLQDIMNLPREDVDEGPRRRLKLSEYVNPGDTLQMSTIEDMRKYGFGAAGSPTDPTKDGFQFMEANGLTPAQYQSQYGALPFKFNDDGTAVYDPAFRQNSFSYEPKDSLFTQIMPMAIGALGAAGLTGMLPGTTNVFSGLGGIGNAASAADSVAGFSGMPNHPYWSMGAENVAGGVMSDAAPSWAGTMGSGVDFAGSAAASNPFAFTPDPMIGALQTVPGAASIGTDLMSMGLTEEGLLAALQGTGSVINGPLGPLAVEAGGASGIALKDLFNSAGNLAAVGGAANQAIRGRETSAETVSRLLKDLGVNVNPNTLGLLGTGLATGLGVYGANEQEKAAEKLANQYMDMGAPYRTELSKLTFDPNSFYKSDMVQGALQQGSDALARSLSAKVGNPILNPTAVQQMQNYTTRGLLDAYNNQFRNLMTAGGLGVGQAAALGTNAIGAQAGVPNALGAGLASVFSNQRDYTGDLMDLMRQRQVGQSLLQG